MNRRLCLAGSVVIIVASWLGASPVSAAPIVLDFANTAHNDTAITNLGDTYTDQGFQLTLSAFPGSDPNVQFVSFGAQRFDYDGEPSIVAGTALSTIELSRVDGGLFSLHSIDLAELPNGQQLPDGTVTALPAPGPFSIMFTGYRAGGGTVTATAIVDPFPSLLTFIFPSEFRGLTSVEWQQGPGGTSLGLATHQFSDINVARVPEPATMWLLLFGIALTSSFKPASLNGFSPITFRRRREGSPPNCKSTAD